MAVDRSLLLSLLAVCAVVPVTSTLLGGYEAASPSDKGVQRAVSFAVDEINKQLNDLYYMKSADILEASVQVVAGKNYHVIFEFVATECRKNEKAPENLAKCGVLLGQNGKTKICDVTVFEQPWKNITELKSFDCEDATPGKSVAEN